MVGTRFNSTKSSGPQIWLISLRTTPEYVEQMVDMSHDFERCLYAITTCKVQRDDFPNKQKALHEQFLSLLQGYK